MLHPANGNKLHPFVSLKTKTMTIEIMPTGIIVRVNQKGHLYFTGIDAFRGHFTKKSET